MIKECFKSVLGKYTFQNSGLKLCPQNSVTMYGDRCQLDLL